MSIRQIIDSILDFQFTSDSVYFLVYLFIGLLIVGFLGGIAEPVSNAFDNYANEKNWSAFKRAYILIVSSLLFAVLIMASVIVITK